MATQDAEWQSQDMNQVFCDHTEQPQGPTATEQEEAGFATFGATKGEGGFGLQEWEGFIPQGLPSGSAGNSPSTESAGRERPQGTILYHAHRFIYKAGAGRAAF